MLQQGKQTQALEHLNQLITTNPKDRSARFLKGVILAEMNKLDEATSVFLKLTEEAPELPEPYNNLAVIYAQQKQYDKARAALEMAIRTHPSYAVAHENLGDLYAKMARQAYDKALQIDAGNASAQTKLNLIRDIISTGVRPATASASAPVKTVAVAAPEPSKPAPTPAPAQVSATPPTAKPTPAPAPQPAPSPASKPAEPVKPAAPAETVSKPEPKKADEKKSEPTTASEEKAIQAAVQSWAAAWSSKNAREYLSFYAKDFEVPDRRSRADWEKERTDRVTKPGNIDVALSDIDVALKGDKAIVKFRQHYNSASLKTTTGKTLEMVRRSGHWQIQQERIGR